MKKRILVVNKSFKVGGIQSSMINLIKELKKYYEVDLYLYYDQGELKNRLPDDINIIKASKVMQFIGMSREDIKKTGNPVLIAARYLVGAWCKYISNKLPLYLAFKTQKKLKGYDVAIAFHHELSRKMTTSGFYRFVADRVEAKLKLGWIHYDSANTPQNNYKNQCNFRKVDKIICVSQGTMKNFIIDNPEFKDKVDFCYNFHDVEGILGKASEKQEIPFDKNFFNCFSACRIEEKDKGILRAIRAFSPVLKRFPDVRWYIAGNGPDKDRAKMLIEEYELQEQIVLLGSLANPYPYMKNADLYIQPSRTEAAPMTFGEANILKTPVLTTDTLSAGEFVKHNETGYICENSEEGLASSLEYILSDREVLCGYRESLKKNEWTNSISLEKFNEIIED